MTHPVARHRVASREAPAAAAAAARALPPAPQPLALSCCELLRRQLGRRRPHVAPLGASGPPPGAGSPPPPPYSRLSQPVYSLSTRRPGDGLASLNIVTYASPVAVQPRTYALGLYVGTLSWESMLASGYGVLQVRTAAASRVGYVFSGVVRR